MRNYSIRKRPSNVPTITAAPWRITLPDGRNLHGRKTEVLKIARAHGVRLVYDRQHDTWRKVDLVTGKLEP